MTKSTHIDEHNKMLHVDDYLNSPDADPIAKEFLERARRPANEKDHPWLRRHSPLVMWQGKEYRCVGASRLGDVWLKGEGPPNVFYDYRVDIAELSNWKRPIERIYGWYDSADQPPDQPSFNPAFPGLCLFCGGQTGETDVRTISLMPITPIRDVTPGPPSAADVSVAHPRIRAYFYRVHRTCHAGATRDQQNAIDVVVLEAIAHNHD